MMTPAEIEELVLALERRIARLEEELGMDDEDDVPDLETSHRRFVERWRKERDG